MTNRQPPPILPFTANPPLRLISFAGLSYHLQRKWWNSGTVLTIGNFLGVMCRENVKNYKPIIHHWWWQRLLLHLGCIKLCPYIPPIPKSCKVYISNDMEILPCILSPPYLLWAEIELLPSLESSKMKLFASTSIQHHLGVNHTLSLNWLQHLCISYIYSTHAMPSCCGFGIGGFEIKKPTSTLDTGVTFWFQDQLHTTKSIIEIFFFPTNHSTGATSPSSPLMQHPCIKQLKWRA